MARKIRKTLQTRRVRRLHKDGLNNMLEAHDLLNHISTLTITK